MGSKIGASFEITIINFATCCRLCLSNETKKTITDSYLQSAQDVSVAEAIKSIANISILSDGNMSNRICGLCLTRLDDAYCFIRDIRNNNDSMRSCLTANDDDDEVPCVISDVGPEHSTEQVNAVDLVLNKIAPSKLKPRTKRGITVRTMHECTTCGKTFRKKSNLIDHERLHEQVKLFKCDYCSKSFVQVANLRGHLRTHTAERPYQCPICPNSFTQSGTLNTHLRGHANIKPHYCDICEKTFITNSDLKKHKLSHSKVKGFQCILCNNRFFTQKIHLRNHLQNYHKLDDFQPLLIEGTLN